MELIIKLPEGEYEDLIGLYKLGLDRPTAYKTFIEKTCVEAIANGTPLPERHGRLIEEPTETDISNTVGGNNDFAECIRDSVKAVFDNATTIVEAELETEEHENDPDGSKAVAKDVIDTLKRQKHNSRLDDETWKEDMDWDARQYEAESEDENE